jgi:enoyl-CoA hydratase
MTPERFDNLAIERRNPGVALLTIRLEATGAAFGTATLRELSEVLSIIADDAEIRVVTLTGSWEHLTARNSIPADEQGEAQQLRQQMNELSKPVIAACDGVVSGAGARFALMCPLRVATRQTEFDFDYADQAEVLSECNQSVINEELIELIRSRRALSATEAASAGLLNRVVENQTELLMVCNELAARISANAPLSIRYALVAASRGLRMSVDEAMLLETALFSLCFATEDMREGTRAFLEKRAPQFNGR